MGELIQGDKRKDCCKQPENLRYERLRPDLAVNVCKVCKCRHFELMVDPGVLAVKLALMG